MPHNKLDVYQRIALYYSDLIQKGAFEVSDPLPSVRSVALEFGVNPNTVMKAYQTLQEQGYIDILPKKGAYVLAKTKQDSPLSLAPLKTVIASLKHHYSDEDILKFVKTYLKGEHHD